MMSEVIVYTLPVCPNCEQLKCLLNENNISYTSRDIEDPDVYADLLLSGCSLVEAPILSIDNEFYDALSGMIKLGVSPTGRCANGKCGF